MSKEKRYYWLKLKNDWFCNKAIKKLRKLAGGDTFTIIYLKMQLKSLENEGKLFFEGYEDSFEEELALDIDEDTENVKVTVQFLRMCGLIEEHNDGEYLLSEVPLEIGSITSSTVRQRRRRDRLKLEKRDNVTLMSQPVTKPSRRDREELELEQELEPELEQDTHTEDSKGESVAAKRQRVDYKKIVDLYNSICIDLPHVLQISDTRKRKLATRLKSYSIDDLQTAFEKAQASDFMTGRVGDWKASFDWIIKSDENMAKILEGNYDNKTKPSADESRQAADDYWASL